MWFRFLCLFLICGLETSAFSRYIRVYDSQGHGGGYVHITTLFKSIPEKLPPEPQSKKQPQHLSFGRVLKSFFTGHLTTDFFSIAANAKVHSSCRIGEGVILQSQSIIKKKSVIGYGTSIGEKTTIEHHATISSKLHIGDNIKVPPYKVLRGSLRNVTLDQDIAKTVEVAQTHDEECCICLMQKANFIAYPCQHQAYCGNCIIRIQECALCRQPIHSKLFTET